MGRLYNDRRWHKLRAAQLRDYPLCKFCLGHGRTEAATVVDHIRPHKGNHELFFDRGNLQSLCKQHHDAAKAKAEARGLQEIGSREDGTPLDPGHHWNTQGPGGTKKGKDRAN